MEKQDKTSGKKINRNGDNNLPDKEFKVIVTKILTELRRLCEVNENFNKKIEKF